MEGLELLSTKMATKEEMKEKLRSELKGRLLRKFPFWVNLNSLVIPEIGEVRREIGETGLEKPEALIRVLDIREGCLTELLAELTEEGELKSKLKNGIVFGKLLPEAAGAKLL